MKYLAWPAVPVSGASRVIRKKAFDYFGDISSDCPTEDSVMAIRSLLLGDGLILPSAGIRYRWHGENLSGASIHAMKFSEIFNQYLRDVEIFRERNYSQDEGSESKCDAVVRWAERNIRVRALKSYLHSTASWNPTSYLTIARNSDISAREKIVLSLRHILARS